MFKVYVHPWQAMTLRQDPAFQDASEHTTTYEELTYGEIGRMGNTTFLETTNIDLITGKYA